VPDWDEGVIGRGVEVLASEEPEPRQVGRRLALGAVAASLAGVGVAGYLAYGALSGGGPHPDTVVPASAAAYVELDLDPAAGQKVAAARFLHKFPALGDQLGTHGDIGRALLSSAFAGADSISFAGDVEPWLGDRVAIALVPNGGGNKLTYEIAAQVKDEAAAKRLLPRLAAKARSANALRDVFSSELGVPSQSPAGWVLQDGYAILAPTQAIADDLATSATAADLADGRTYRQDVRPLGARVATLWADASALGGLADSELGDVLLVYSSLGMGQNGRTALGLRFTSSAAEVVGFNTARTGTAHTAQLASLPADTMVGLEMTGAGEAARLGWAGYQKQFDPYPDVNDPREPVVDVAGALKQHFGITMPDDLVNLFSADVLVAVGGSRAGPVPVSARATVAPGAASHLLDAARRLADSLDLAPATRTADGLAWSNNADFDAAVGKGGLGRIKDFRDAVPGVEDATWAIYVNWTKVAAAAHDHGTISHLGTLGITMHPDGDRTRIFGRLTGS
jgi:Protein of unknown function (DUF3352)